LKIQIAKGYSNLGLISSGFVTGDENASKKASGIDKLLSDTYILQGRLKINTS
jgi:hypothetical protein